VPMDWLESRLEDADIKHIYNLRQWVKLSSTFVEPYIDCERIHTQFHTLKSEYGDYGTVTGRLSSSKPNLQNVPSRDKEHSGIIRGFFEPEDGHEWYSFDYSQIEFRLAVNFGKGWNGEQLRLQYIKDPDTDFHQVVMDWTHLPRKEAKIANFSLVYGGWIPMLQKQLKSTEEEAERIYNLYHETFPTIRHTFFYYRKIALNNEGEIRTIWNRLRTLKKGHERKAFNTFIQGSAADIMKQGMLDLKDKGVFDSVGYPLLTVHDSLDFSFPENIKTEVVKEIKETMEKACNSIAGNPIKVPIRVNLEKGPNWGDLTKVNL